MVVSGREWVEFRCGEVGIGSSKFSDGSLTSKSPDCAVIISHMKLNEIQIKSTCWGIFFFFFSLSFSPAVTRPSFFTKKKEKSKMQSQGETESLPSYRKRLRATAGASLTLAEPTIWELGELLSRLASRVKTPAHTGLPAFVRHIKREEEQLRSVVDECDADAVIDAVEGGPGEEKSREEEEGTERKKLRKLAGKMHGSVIFIEQACRLWSILKRCRSIVAVNQTFQSSTKETRRQAIADSASSGVPGDSFPHGKDRAMLHRELRDRGRVEVHVVDRGYEWLDIRPVSLERLARQMTDAGWGWGEHAPGDAVNEDEWESVLLAQQLRRTAAAARRNRCEYRIPRVRLVLPNVRRGANEDVDIFLDQLVRIHPHVEIIIEDAGGAFLQSEPLDLEDALNGLVGSELDGLTAVINLDHTILVDLISDITHSKLEPQEWQDRTTQAQIEQENSHQGGLMAKTLYPILRGRKLVCTREAAEHFHEVLKTVGTATECRRGHILIPYPESPSSLAVSASDLADGTQLHSLFSALSVHPPPDDVQVPVTVLPDALDFEAGIRDGRLPRLARDVARCGGFKSAKLSIYMYGWMEDVVTVTSNKEIRGQIRTWVEANRREGEEGALGPRIYRFDMTRNLLAKSATPPEWWEMGGSRLKGDSEHEAGMSMD